MGEYERKSRKRKRNQDLTQLILGTVAAAGIISAALIAPGILVAIDKLGLVPAKRSRDSTRQARVRLIEQGLLKYKDGFVSLTVKGQEALDGYNDRKFEVPKPKRWDGKWRVLIFDVPEVRKVTRERIRNSLIDIGFCRLQDSVWLYPYDCEDLVVLLKAELKIGRDLIYMIVDAIEADERWRKHFGLRIE